MRVQIVGAQHTSSHDDLKDALFVPILYAHKGLDYLSDKLLALQELL